MELSSPKVHNVKQNLVLHKDSKSHEKFMWDIYVAVARQYSNNLSEETKKGLSEKASQGWFPGNQKRGYKTIGEIGHRVWIIDDDTVDHIFIPKAFELFDTGNFTLRTLSKELFKLGWKTKNDRQISTSELHKILKDPFYCGEFFFHNKLYTKGNHTPLISKDLFYSVQDRLTRKIKAGKYKKHNFLFGGSLISCGYCNKAVSWESKKGHSYGHCTNHGNSCPSKKYAREEAINNQILQILDEIRIDNPRLLEWIRKALKEANNNESNYHEVTLKELDKQLLKIQKRLSVLYDDRVDGIITKEQYENKRLEYEEQVASILESKEKHFKADVDYRKLGMNIFELSQKGREIYETKATMDEKKEFLNFVFSTIKLKDDRIVPTFQNGFEVVALRAKDKNWLAHL